MFEAVEYITDSAEETFELSYSIGESLQERTIFLLCGDLGAGKTVFAKGIAAGLEIDPADVSSPTFTIINQYDGRMHLYHLDLYRLSGTESELREIGHEEICSEEGAVVIIEWAERLKSIAWMSNCYRVEISDMGGESRRISIVSCRGVELERPATRT